MAHGTRSVKYKSFRFVFNLCLGTNSVMAAGQRPRRYTQSLFVRGKLAEFDLWGELKKKRQAPCFNLFRLGSFFEDSVSTRKVEPGTCSLTCALLVRLLP